MKDILTSVKVHEKLFNSFKVESIKNKITFTKLVERSLYLYLTNEDFKNQINSQFNTEYGE